MAENEFEHFSARKIDDQIEQCLDHESSENPQTDLSLQVVHDLENYFAPDVNEHSASLQRVWQRFSLQRTQRLFAQPPSLQRHSTNWNNKNRREEYAMHHKHKTYIEYLNRFTTVAILTLIVGSMAFLFATARQNPSNVGNPPPVAEEKREGNIIFTKTLKNLALYNLQWSPDSKRILFAGEKLRMWDATTGKNDILYFEGPLQPEYTTPAKLSPDGKLLAYRASTKTVAIIDIATKKQIQTLKAPESATALLSGGGGIFGLAGGAIPGELDPGLHWTPDSKFLRSQVLVGEGPNTLITWNARTGEHTTPKLPVSQSGYFAYYPIWSPDSKVAAVANLSSDVITILNDQGKVEREYDPMFKTLPKLAKSEEWWVNTNIIWSPDGRYLAVPYGTTDSSKTAMRILELASGKFVAEYNTDGDDAFAWSPDSQRFAFKTSKGIGIYNTSNGKLLDTLTGEKDAYILAWSPNGKYISSGSFRQEKPGPFETMVKIWRVDS